MTSDEIIKLVEDNGLTLHGDIEHFAHLVAQHEREACADLLMGLHHTQMGNHNYYHYAANAIEELRGNT